LNETGDDVFKNAHILPVYNGVSVVGLVSLDGRIRVGNCEQIINLKALRVYDEVIITDTPLSLVSFFEAGLMNVICLLSFESSYIMQLMSERLQKVVLAFNDTHSAELLRDILVMNGCPVKVITPVFTATWNEELKKGMNRESVTYQIEKAVIVNPAGEQTDFKVNKDGLNYIFTLDEITYRLYEVKEVFVNNLKVGIKAEYNGEKFPDRIDLYASRSRDGYARTVSSKFGIETKKVEKDLLAILDYLEGERDRELALKNGAIPSLTDAERVLGLSFLECETMFNEIASDMEVLGYVGEDLNKQLLYIAASTRLLDDPISVLILSQSASGKSLLVDTVEKLIPDNEVVSVTGLSDQALNYIDDLTHKFLVFGEAEHNETVEHQIREMLSSKELSRLVTIKDEKTGKMKSSIMKKKVLVSCVMSTTNHRMNPENMSRFFVINADESGEQTRRIHEAQRHKYSLSRLESKKSAVPEIVSKHKAAQRLLKKYAIVNPFAKYLDFPIEQMRTRRDHDRFLDLIAGVCFLRQYQKNIEEQNGVQYIECDVTDYKIARDILVNSVLSSTLSELPKSLIEFYNDIRKLMTKRAKESGLSVLECTFDLRDIRQNIKWLGVDTARKYLRNLANYEYIAVASGVQRGQRMKYSLTADEMIERLDISMIPTVDKMIEMIHPVAENPEIMLKHTKTTNSI